MKTQAPLQKNSLQHSEQPTKNAITAQLKDSSTQDHSAPNTQLKSIMDDSPRHNQARALKQLMANHDKNKNIFPSANLNNSIYDKPPIQRTIRVDSIDDGDEFEKIDFVPTHFGLSSAGANTYKKWIADSEDHHYTTKPLLVSALEAASQPSTKTFSDIFIQAAQADGIDIHWLEQYLTDMNGTLLTLNQETPEDIVEKIKVRNPHSTITVDQIESFTLKELMDEVLTSNIMTQSCGQTANLIHEFLSPSTTKIAPLEIDLPSLSGFIKDANKKSASTLKHQYVKIEGGGHAFIIEVFNDQCKIFQSFFGRYSFAKNLALNKKYEINTFINKMNSALTTSSITDTTTKQVESDRTELFNSLAVHPDGHFRISTFEQEDGTEDRISDKLETQKSQWNPKLQEQAEDHLSVTTTGSTSNSAPPVTIMDYDYNTISSMLIFDNIDDADIENGSLPTGTLATYNGFTFILESKSNTNYKFVYRPN